MGRGPIMGLKAENKSKLLSILRSIDVVTPLENGYRKKDATEPYAVAHLLSSLAEVPDALAFPLELSHRANCGDAIRISRHTVTVLLRAFPFLLANAVLAAASGRLAPLESSRINHE